MNDKLMNQIWKRDFLNLKGFKLFVIPKSLFDFLWKLKEFLSRSKGF